MSDQQVPPLYPRNCFQLSPTFDVWCLLRATDIQALKRRPEFEGQDFYFYRNLPIKWVRIVGIVVAIDEFAGRRVFTVDDSSGSCLEAVATGVLPKQEEAGKEEVVKPVSAWLAVPPPKVVLPYDDIDVGTVVDLKGQLSIFREEMQIKIEKLVPLKTTEKEVALWEKRDAFRHEVLDRPWILTSKQVRKCQKEAEREDSRRTRKHHKVARR